MRLFTAIDLPDDLLDHLTRILRKMRPLAPLAWSRPENLHITTKFIGEWPEDRLPELIASLAHLPTRPPIPIQLRQIEFFPDSKRPRMLWIRVEPDPLLSALAKDTDSALAALGIEPESRPYTPHLTLARIKKPGGLKNLAKEVEHLNGSAFRRFEAGSFHLYLSKPGPAGSVYTKLSDFPFTIP